MANTTDMIITCFDEDDIVEHISKETKINFLKISDSTKCGGHKVVAFESYAASYRCIGKGRIEDVIRVFKSSDFTFPELAVLVIDDDNLNFSSVVTI